MKEENYETHRDELTKTDRREWSDEEIKVLKDNYKNKTDKELSKILDKRTPQAINHKRYKLGLRKR